MVSEITGLLYKIKMNKGFKEQLENFVAGIADPQLYFSFRVQPS